MTGTRARRSLSNQELEELLDHVADRLQVQPCDHTLRHTAGFLARRGFEVAPVTSWLNHRGGHCDCEVLMNVDERGWE